MKRTPKAKSQASILVRELESVGITLKHQQALDVVAKMSGYRDWNAMAATAHVAEQREPAATSLAEAHLGTLLGLSRDVLHTRGKTAGDEAGSFTSVYTHALEKLANFIDKLKDVASRSNPMADFNPGRQVAILWDIRDVQSVRPDLTDSEAFAVLQQADRRHDATIGINWDVLECLADMSYQERDAVACTFTYVDKHGNTEVDEGVEVDFTNEGLLSGNDVPNGTIAFDGFDDEQFAVVDGKLCGGNLDELREILNKLEAAGVLEDVSQ